MEKENISIQDLPNEILSNILFHTPPEDTLSIRLTNKNFNKFLFDKLFSILPEDMPTIRISDGKCYQILFDKLLSSFDKKLNQFLPDKLFSALPEDVPAIKISDEKFYEILFDKLLSTPLRDILSVRVSDKNFKKILSDKLFYLRPEDMPEVKQLEVVIRDNIFWENKFKLHFPHDYEQLKEKHSLTWYNEFCSKYEIQYEDLSGSIKRLFSIAKEGAIKFLKDYIAQNSAENNWLKHIAMKDKNGVSVLEWIRTNDHQTLLNYIYENIIKIDANCLITINEKIKLSPQSTLWFVLCRQPENQLNALVNVDDVWINGYQAIHFAVENGNRVIVKKLLNNIENINARSYEGLTPLHLAIRHNQSTIIKKLLKNGADINANTCIQGTPFFFAILHFKQDIQIFLNAKPNIQVLARIYNYSILHLVALQRRTAHKRNINIEMAEKLLSIYDKEIRAIINNININGLTALHIAAGNGDYDMVKFLIKMGADINAVESIDKQTPLFFAVNSECLEVITLLIVNKANINAVDIQDQTPLHIAVEKNLTSIAAILLKNNARINTNQNSRINPDKEPLLHIAILNLNSDILSLLLEYSIETALQDNEVAYVDSVDKFSSTALHLAVEKGLSKFVEKLLEYNANINISNENGDKPIDIAQREGYTDIVNLINIQSLYNYIEQLSQHSDIHRHGLFKFTAGEKLEAAKALKRVVCDNADPSCLEAHKEALNEGELKKIFSSLLPIIKKVSLDKSSSIEIIKNQP